MSNHNTRPGPKPRTDDRHGRLVRVALNDEEYLRVLKLTTDQRRERLLAEDEHAPETAEEE